LILIGWIISSPIWADEFGTSVRRSMLPALMLVGALGIARHWPPERLCLMAVHLGFAYIFIGICAELQVGTFLRGSDYRFSGTLHPNSQAVNCMAALLGSVCLLLGGSKFRRTCLMVAGLSLVMLVLTGSRTGFGSLLAAMCALFGLRASPRQFVYFALGGGLLACMAIMGMLLMSDVELGDSMLDVARMGRELEAGEVSSLTGRIPIWKELSRHIAERPMFGHGYGSFWTGQRVYDLSAILNWEFNHAHSAYLESLLNIGFIGVAIGLTVVVVGIRRALTAARQSDSIGYQFLLVWLLTGVIHGFAEPSFIQPEFAAMIGTIGLSMLVFRERPSAEATV
jgi:O-antigen ligase